MYADLSSSVGNVKIYACPKCLDGAEIERLTERLNAAEAALDTARKAQEGLFERIAHGDHDHREWLRQELGFWFSLFDRDYQAWRATRGTGG